MQWDGNDSNDSDDDREPFLDAHHAWADDRADNHMGEHDTDRGQLLDSDHDHRHGHDSHRHCRRDNDHDHFHDHEDNRD